MSNEKFMLREVGPTTDAANAALSKALADWFMEYGPQPVFKNCANCTHMPPNSTPAKCTKFDAHPPALVIIKGCPAHEDAEEIPF